MKRWFLAFLALTAMLTLALPVSAARPLPIRPVEQPVRDLYVPVYQFPQLDLAQVEATGDPHARVRLLAQGTGTQDEAWAFTLVERRWGWEIEAANVNEGAARALALASLDYLNGDAQALGIFFAVPGGYLETLRALRAF